jgi:hypothetical protein
LKVNILVLFAMVFFLQNTYAQIPTTDTVTDPNIRTVLFYADRGEGAKSHLSAAVTSLKNNAPIVLEFDDTSGQYQNYHLKIYPCNADWQLINLNEVEYVSEYNDIILQNYQLSYSTKRNYYHYKINLPTTKIGGNFIAYIYKEQRKAEPIITRRFCVNAAKVNVGGRATVSNNNLLRSSKQQVDFGIQYAGYQVINPLADFKVVLRQNYRWDRTLTGLKPQYLRASESKIDYQFYNSETDFDGGNEFRFFDMRSLRNKFVGLHKITYTDTSYHVELLRDMPQGHKVYIFTDDFDGQYLIDHYENGNAEVEGDYANVTFKLETDDSLAQNQELYVLGAFNNYKCEPSYQMHYNAEQAAYTATIELKQGLYNYQYAIKNLSNGSISTHKTEGNHAKTQNTYEIFVYHKPIGARSEQLVGYSQFQIFNR